MLTIGDAICLFLHMYVMNQQQCARALEKRERFMTQARFLRSPGGRLSMMVWACAVSPASYDEAWSQQRTRVWGVGTCWSFLFWGNWNRVQLLTCLSTSFGTLPYVPRDQSHLRLFGYQGGWTQEAACFYRAPTVNPNTPLRTCFPARRARWTPDGLPTRGSAFCRSRKTPVRRWAGDRLSVVVRAYVHIRVSGESLCSHNQTLPNCLMIRHGAYHLQFA